MGESGAVVEGTARTKVAGQKERRYFEGKAVVLSEAQQKTQMAGGGGNSTVSESQAKESESQSTSL